MNSSLGLKSIKSLVLTSAVAILALVLIASNASAQLSNSGAPKDKSGDKSEKKKDKEKKNEKSKSGGERAEAQQPVVAPAALTATLETVVATIETDPVPNGGDAADDPAIWVNPNDSAQSIIIGTDKRGGLAVYDLSGKQIQYLSDGQMDNVDLRDGVKLGGQTVGILTGSNRKDNSIAVYKINPQMRTLENVAARKIKHGLSVYGSRLYPRAQTAQHLHFWARKTREHDAV